MNNNLLESIEILKKNKQNFKSNDDYLKILTNLYNEISRKNLLNQNFRIGDLESKFASIKLLDVDFNINEKKKLFDLILKSVDFYSIIQIKNIKKLTFIIPLIELLFVENKLIELCPDKKFQIQTEPIIELYNKQDVVDLIKVLLNMNEKAKGYKNKILLFIAIYDCIFKNFKLLLDYNNFAITVKNKINEFEKDLDKINEVCELYGLEKNFYGKWKEVLDNINV